MVAYTCRYSSVQYAYISVCIAVAELGIIGPLEYQQV